MTTSAIGSIDWSSVDVEVVHGAIAKRSVTYDRFTVVRYDFPSGGVFPMHAHAESQATVVVAGAFTFATPEGLTTYGPGEIAIVPGHTPHEGRADHGPATIVCVLTPARARG